ncbi:MAG TPA: amino acid adenylation domain-containing protein [Candidatus Kapabacteria bacterium]|nr:amino acid adenylation domain-containing protein [Candidatus Kapabacteria bacterium]
MEQVEKTPDFIAIVGNADVKERKRRREEEKNGLQIQITYRQLNEKSGRLAGLLIEKGVLPDTIVGIMMERSVEMIIGIMAILKAGSAYLPIDPGYPQERIQYMLADCNAKILFNKSEARISKHETNPNDQKINVQNQNNQFKNVMILDFKNLDFEFVTSFESRVSNFDPLNLAYLIYTSGSTGKPKGVVIEHRSVVNLLFAMQNQYPLFPSDTYLLKTSYTFDVSVTELFGWFMGGGKLAILKTNGEKDPQVILDCIQRHYATYINFVPSMFNAFLGYLTGENKQRLACLKYIFLAGEAILPGLVTKFKGLNIGITLENLYGPTEGTIYSSQYSLSEWNGIDNVPIGKPLANIKLYILNKYNHLQPLGIPGELYIGGNGVARGYLNNPELTAGKFIFSPNFLASSFPNFLLYRTGDLARWLPHSNIEFLGRRDSQVKIRGFRIELGEIENRLLKHKHIKEAVVLVNENEGKDKNLIAYIVSSSELLETKLREYLREELPDYMLPSHFVPLEKIPLTPNGKLDRKALPKPELKAGDSYIAPRNEIEKKLVEIWSDVLSRDELHAMQVKTSIGIDDNFFHLGGHSLKATVLVSKIHKEFQVNVPLSEIFKTPTIRGEANYIKSAMKDKYISIEPVEKKEYYSLSSAQKRLYILHQMDRQRVSYNIPFFSVFAGEIDKDKLQSIFKQLINRHESLRTSFHMINNEPVQRIHDEAEFEIKYKDLAANKHGQTRPQSVGNLLNFIQPFDLSQAPLLRVVLAKEKENHYILLVDMHHIIADGTSINILIKDFMALYQGNDLPGLRVQYKDFSTWQNHEKHKESIKRQMDFWENEFAGEIPVLELPGDFPRPAVQSFEGSCIHFEIDKETAGVLKKLALEMDVTIYMILLAFYTMFLYRLTNQEDIVVGCPIAGRRHADTEKIIGMFVNTMALRNYPSGDKIFTRYLHEIKEKTLRAFENQDCQYEDLVEQVVKNRDVGRNPLFDTVFVLQNMDITEINITDLKLSPYPYENKTAKFDLTLSGIEEEGKLSFTFEYCSKLFREKTIERFIDYFKNLVNDFIENKNRKRICDFEILTEEEKKLILFDFNDTETDYPGDKTIHQLFAEQVERVPDRIAVAYINTIITYRQLNEQANRLAGLLLEKGVQPDTIVGIMMERSIEMIISIIGILKAGGAYLPIDPDYPKERIKYMLQDSNAGIIVNSQFLMNAPQAPFHQHSAFSIHHSNHLAYVIYTSGSTGKAKSVMVEHRNVARLVKNTTYIKLNPRDRILPTGALAFDASTFEIWGGILNGLTLYLVSNEIILNAEKLKKTTRKYQVTIMWMTSPLFNQTLEIDIEAFAGLRTILVGGDKLSVAHINRLKNRYPHLDIINGYGPTENTTFSTTFLIDREYSENIPIGKPIANSTAYIVDIYNRLQPIGVPGELLVGGDGIARGYMNNPELTAERFYRSYWSYKSYINYKTGDIAKWLSDGNIEFLGRIDHQVKIRGFRIELGEIENQLMKYPGVKEALVLAQEERGDKYLCAYIVSDGKDEISRYREYLSLKLPVYMIPSYFIPLEKIPLTPNGKIDRKVLQIQEVQAGKNYRAPGNKIEMKLVELWSTILGREELHAVELQKSIGIDENFFHLGGHSLKATILASKIHKELNVHVPLAEIFKRSTIRELAKYISNKVEEKFEAIPLIEKKDYYELSSAQKRLFFLHQLDRQEIGYNIPCFMLLEGKIDKDRFEHTFRQLINRHESLRTSFHIIKDEPVQRIHDEVEFEIRYLAMDTPSQHRQTQTFLLNFIRPFDLSQAPLLRVGLLEEKEERHLLMVDIHHIVSDGTSMNIVVKDFMSLYQVKELPALRLQYKDFSGWQNSEKHGESLKRQGEYWLDEFEGEIPVLELPIDYPRPTFLSFEGSNINFEIDRKTTEMLNKIALETDATTYMILLTVYVIFLAKITNQEDIVVGSPIAGRRHEDLGKIIGMFVNTLALRNFPLGEKTFIGFLHEVKTKTLNAFENQDYQFEYLVDLIVSNRDTSRNPVFEVMFVLQNMGIPEIQIPGLILKPYHYENKTAKFDLNLVGLEKDGKLIFNLEYSTKLFKEKTILRFRDYFKNLINTICENPEARISAIGIMNKEEKESILELCCSAVEPEVVGETVYEIFEEITIGHKDKIALVFRDGRLTYGELNQRADVLARMLQDNGIGRDSVVGLMIERSFPLVIGILGIMKAGGAYLPIDPKLPQERIDYMLEDSNAAILLIKKEQEIIDNCQLSIVNRKQMSLPQVHFHYSKQLVYIIYTSGSTGKPKGVMLDHGNLVNLVCFHYKYTNIDFSKVLQFTTISFDVSFQEIFSTLLHGGELYLIDEETRVNIILLLEFIRKNKIKTLFLPMSFLRLIFEEEYTSTFPTSVAHIITAGEKAIVNDSFRNCLKENNIHFHNHYGPSETHVITTFTMNPQEDIPGFPPIGKPVQNTVIYILDKAQQLLPIGVAGELYACGLQVGRGYLNNPELTAEKFIFSPNSLTSPFPNFLLYRTGDQARWQINGNIEFLGRIDQQVKIHGIRVEPGEIEHQLQKIDIIKDAVIAVKQDKRGEKYLCAYIVLNTDTALNESGLKNILSVNLPDYMVPSYFVQMDKIPLTPSGKIDKKALPGPEFKIAESYIAPGDELEKKLVILWAEVLGKDELHSSQLLASIGISDNFFQLGGHSLKAVILISKIHKELKIKVPLAEIFKAPSIMGLAEFIKRTGESGFFSIVGAEKKEYYALASAQKRIYILQQMDKDGTAYNIPVLWLMEGLLNMDKLKNAIDRLIQRHESLRTSFVLVGEKTVQKIHEHVDFEIEYENCNSSIDYPDYKEEKDNKRHHSPFSTHNFIRAFDLSKPPLLRVGLIKLAEDKHIFLVDMHHIISDGMSSHVLAQDFSAFYAGAELPQIMFQYKDYAEWQNREKVSKKVLEQGEYWKKEFTGEIPMLDLPTDYARPVAQAFEGSSINFELNSEISNALKALALEAGATLYIVLLALYTSFLSKLCGQEDIVIGSPVAGRQHADLEKIIGMFVNTLVLRNYPIGEKTFKEYLLEVKEKTLSAFENQEYPYEDLVDQVVMNRDVSRNPLFDVMFALQNTGSQKIEIPGLKLVPYEYDLKTTKVDLALTVVEVEEKLLLIFRYSTKLFKNKTIERLIGYFKNVITHIISKPCVKMSEVEIIPEETRQAILNHFNENLSGVSELKPIQIILSDIFQKYRENTAIDYGATCITYAELEHRAACISQWIKDRNILAGSFMGIYIENKINIISSIIGILQRACIFVPMDTNLPRKRLENMIRLTNMQVILTDAGHEILLSGIKDMAGNSPNNFVIDDSFYRSCKPDGNKNANSKYDSGDKIYVYFTSGSTGIPNAIVGKNKSLVQFIQWEIETFAVNENYRISQLTSVGFDAFLRDVFVPFFAGGTICIPADKEILIDRNTLIDWLESKRINLVHCVPSLFHIILSGKLTPSLFPGLKNILLSGEPINPNELRGWYQVFGERIQLVNYYGPTETTMIKTFHHITMGDIEAGTVPAGRPIIGTRIIILDKYMKICDQGIIGEIYVRTAYGTHGYLDNPGLNAQRFIQNPFGAAEGDLVYKTGDLGRLLENGEILVLGRIDRQIKIRGVRIELENIENCLLEHGKIERAIVICRKDGAGENYLCAYIVFKKQQTTGGARQDEDDIPHTPELREFLAGELPDYMIPSYFVQIENIPLTANGKIDRKALPKPGLIAGESYIAPKGEIEKKLVELWAGILCRDEAHASQLKTSIGIDDNFFQLGGHSLKATILVSGIHKGLNVQVPLVEIFKRPTVRGLAEYIKGKVEEKYQSIEPAEKKEYYELSSAQKRLFFLRQLDPDGVAYNIPVIIPLPGDFQLEKLDDIFKELIKRHDNLRTSFHLLNSGPVQKIHDEVKFEIEYFATDTLPQNRQTQTLTEVFGSIFFQKGGFIRPFDLLRAPLMRAGLVKNSDGSYVLLVDIHHIITDGTSQEVLKHDFMSLYRGEPLPSLRLQYKDFAQWQNSNKENDRIKRQELYWLKEFPGEIPVLSIPTDYPRPLMQSFAGNKINFEIPAAETGLLHDLALRIGATLFMVLAAVLNILLAKLSGQEDIVIGTPVAGRRHADLEKIIGIFVNTLALRNYPVGENTFPGFLDLLKNRTLEAFENQEYPFDDLVEKVSISRDMGRNPLFDVLFVLQNIIDVPAEAVFEKRMVEDENITRTVKFDLEITAWEAGQELKFVFGYGTKLFKKETIEQCITYFKRIVSIVVKDLGIRIKDIDLISEEEKKQILSGFNDTAAEYPEDKTIHRLFAEQASKTPGHIALVGAGSQTCPARNDCPVWITYRQLDKQSDDLAGLLIEKGVQTDSIVAIMMERSVEMVIAIFGILKSSGAYLPIDPEYPQERIEYMLKDSGTKILLTNDEKKKDNCQCSIVNCQLSMRVDSQEFHHSSFELPRVHHSNHLCYIIYTSGSTGNPKGVMIEHAAVHNFIEGMIRCIDFKPGKKILALTTISFDIFGLEILLPLCKGLMVVIANEEHQRDIQLLKQLILKSGVEMLQATPSRMQMLIENEGENSSLRNLTEIMVGGEALPGKLNADLAKLTTANMYNMYGPTETTIWSTVKKLNGTKNITVGKPIINTQVYILSKYLQLQPVGIPGEMYISGNGVAIGYLNRPELTAEKFQFNRSYRSYKSNILYKTGDLARWLPNGDIEFLGRMDYQVKVKGFRIELEEIEKNLKLHENIKDAVVITNGEATEQYLCAYIVSTVELRVTELREYLARKLPGYMIPSSFIKIDKIPVNLSGKVDRNVLRNYRGGRLGSDAIFVEPSTDIEKTLAALWKEVLKLEKISIYDNFFELGGNSLKVVQLNDKLREVFKIDIPVAVMFRYLNIYSFTKYLNENSNPASEQIKKSGHLENLKQSARTYKDTVKRFKKGEKNERK